MAAKKRSSSKRELIDTGTDKRYVKRDAQGQFKESDDVGRSLAADRRRKAKTTTKSGYGDQGDRKPAAKKASSSKASSSKKATSSKKASTSKKATSSKKTSKKK
jgi:hypothetical protein